MYFLDTGSMRHTLLLLKEGEFSEEDRSRLTRAYVDIRALFLHVGHTALLGGLFAGGIAGVAIYSWQKTVIPFFSSDLVIALGMTVFYGGLVCIASRLAFNDYRKERKSIAKELTKLFNIAQFKEDFNTLRQIDQRFGQAVRNLMGPE
jgi:hypothetical protein